MRILLAFVIAAAAPAAAVADDWIGQRVITKRNGVKFGHTGENGEQVYVGELKEPVVTVLEDKGEWLRVQSKGKAGWFPKADAVSVKDAAGYFTDLIRDDPAQAAHHFRRALVWDERKEYDNAVKDYTEAIRLKPEYASSFNNRGNVWLAKKEYSKAVEDRTESIRLNPKNANAFNNRGFVWATKKEYSKAVEDYTEAIRLDPMHDNAFNNRGNAWRAKKEYDKAVEDYTEAIRLDPKDADAVNNRAWLRATCPDEKCRDGAKAVEDS